MVKEMPKGLIILANGFEESEAIITIDLLRRANIEVDLVSLTNSINVTSSGNITVVCDKLYGVTSLEDYNFLVIPGGKAVFNYHLESNTTKEIVDETTYNSFLQEYMTYLQERENTLAVLMEIDWLN